MKLKLVVASMSILGLISCPTFAATQSDAQDQTQTVDQVQNETTTQTTPVKAKKVVHHTRSKRVRHHQVAEPASVPVEPAPVVTTSAPALSQPSVVLEQMTQNVGRAMPMPEWFNRIGVSGGLNVDMGKWGNRSKHYTGENYERVSLNDAYLNVTGTVNRWTSAFVGLSYNNTNLDTGLDPSVSYGDSVYPTRTLSLEQGYVTLANFDCTPFFAQAGKQFTDFGRYKIHPITRSLTQVLSESLQTSAKVGFVLPSGFYDVPVGFNGSVYVFDTKFDQYNIGSGTVSSTRPTNYGASLGIDRVDEMIGFDAGVSYMYNMLGVNDVGHFVSGYTELATAVGDAFINRVGALAVYGDINSGPFSLGGRYTTSLQTFNVLDLPKNGHAPSTSGASPWAASLQAGYDFNVWEKNQNIYLGYQASGESAALAIPQQRWIVGYDIEVLRSTNLGVEYLHDTDYSVSHGGTGDSPNQVSLRASVAFG